MAQTTLIHLEDRSLGWRGAAAEAAAAEAAAEWIAGKEAVEAVAVLGLEFAAGAAVAVFFFGLGWQIHDWILGSDSAPETAPTTSPDPTKPPPKPKPDDKKTEPDQKKPPKKCSDPDLSIYDLCTQYKYKTPDEAKIARFGRDMTIVGEAANDCAVTGDGTHWKAYDNRKGKHVFLGTIVCCTCCVQPTTGDAYTKLGCN